VNYSVSFLPSEQLRGGILFKSVSPLYSEYLEKLYKTNIIAGIAGELIFRAYEKGGISDISNAANQVFNVGNPLALYVGQVLSDNQKDNLDTWEKGINIPFKDSTGEITGSLFGIDINGTAKSLSSEELKANNGVESDKQVYIDLSSFLKILNKYVIPVDQNNDSPIVPLSLEDREYPNEIKEDLLCLYHPLQISVDPSICLIKNTKIRGLKNVSVESQNITSVFNPKNIYADNKTKQLISFTFKSFVRSMLIKLVNSKSIDERINIIKTEVDLMVNTAVSKGLTKNEATEIIANVWEDYKYISSISSPLSGVTNYFIVEGNENLYQSTNKNETAELTFLNILRYSLTFSLLGTGLLQNNPEENLKLALGSDYNSFYKATDVVRNFSVSQIKEKFNRIENENLTQALPFESIEFLNKLELNYEKDNSGFGIIGNIYINLNNVLELSMDGGLESNDVKEKREINLYDFLKKLINQIQGSIGSINNFDIHVDPIDGIARIIDINYVDLKSKSDAYKNAYTFLSQSPTEVDAKLDGLFNNIRSYKINSKIFKEQSSIVAISAQNGGGVMGLDNETLVGFNKGITNRLIPNSNPKILYDYSKEIKTSELINNVNSSLSILLDFLKDLNWIPNQYILFDKSREYKVGNAEQYKNMLRDFIATYQSITTTPSSFRAIIPTTVSLELDGIGGLIIGHMFRLPSELLPAGYKTIDGIGRKQGFIITKLGHKVSNSDWITDVEAQTIILEDNNDIQKFNLNDALNAAEKGSNVSITTDGNINVNTNEIKGTPVNISKKPLVEQIISYAKRKGINDPQRLTAILTVAQAETSLNPLEVESLKYSVNRAKAVFPNKLKGKTDAQIAQIFSSDLSAGEFLYGNQFGNNQPGDGAKYRGRGLTQITFKGNYITMNSNLKKAGENIDIVSTPELANQVDNSIKILIIGKIYGQFGAPLKQGVNYKNNASDIIKTQNGNTFPNAETLQVYERALASINSTTWIQDLLK
jgi:predicted chitinase